MAKGLELAPSRPDPLDLLLELLGLTAVYWCVTEGGT